MNWNEDTLRQDLSMLPDKKQLAFALLVCERMMPGFSKFARETRFNIDFYRRCLEGIWHYLEGAGVSHLDLVASSKKCLDDAPDTEEFDHHLTSAALNAALSIAATMSFLIAHSVDRLIEAARFAYDKAFLYAQPLDLAPHRSMNLKQIVEQPPVQDELRRQADDLAYLKSLPKNNSNELVDLIRERIANTPALP